jgi:cytochrome c
MVISTLALTLMFSVGVTTESEAASHNPCAAKANPCNPCAAKAAVKKIRNTSITDQAALIAWGKKLWNDPKLGNSGLACQSCHINNALLNLDKVGPFPHYVKMPNDIVTLDQMINFCMINPMKTEPLDPNSLTMTALASYYQQIVADYKTGKGLKAATKMNPCNPCAAKMNPCAAKANPCAAKMNPCARKKR